MGISLGFEIAKRALMAQRQAMDVAGHNIANANTPGFSRQRANLKTTAPFPEVVGRDFAGVGQIGSGVEVANITRMRDAFLDKQFRQSNTDLGRWDTKEQVLAEIEELFNEPSDVSLQSNINQLWAAWQTLSNNPENLAAREAVRQQALSFVSKFREVDSHLTDVRQSINAAVEAKVKEVNTLADEVAKLNTQISSAYGTNLMPNDLEDQRDLLLDKLSKLSETTVVDDVNGMVRVIVNGVALVDGVRANHLGVEADATNGNLWKLKWESSSATATVQNGELGAYLALRDGSVYSYQKNVRKLAWAVVDAMNTQHKAGFDLNGAAVAATPWENFFSATTPPTPEEFNIQSLDVNPDISADVRRIAAASQANRPGDGSNALAIASVKQNTLAILGGFTGDDYYRSVIASLGSEVQEAKHMQENQTLLVQKVENQRTNQQGVNLDEEMMDLVRFQHAFDAAARLVSVMDGMMDTLINRLGAGR